MRLHLRAPYFGRVSSAWAASALVALLLMLLPPLSAAPPDPSPYAGQESRDIKALGPQEVESLLAGKGMGFARAAELNGYPGPAHVLELAEALELSEEQRDRTRALFVEMEQKAVSLGSALVAAERRLDRLFADRSATPQSLSNLLNTIGELQAGLRDAHLQAHLVQAGFLTAAQTARYAQLRGYSTAPQPAQGQGRAQGHGDGHGHDRGPGNAHDGGSPRH